MVSFKGFQKGAILEARASNIDLLQFRKCTEKDIIDENGTPYLLELNVKSQSYTPIFKIYPKSTKLISPQLNEFELKKFNQ